MCRARTISTCMAALAFLLTVQSTSAQGKLEGVWKVTEASMSGPQAFKDSNPQPSLFIFAKKHFSKSSVTGDKPRPVQSMAKAADAHKLAVWEPFEADAGTYEVKGATVTLQGVVAKDPEDMQPGKPHTYDFKIEGKTLFLTMKANEDGPLPNPIEYKLVRVE